MGAEDGGVDQPLARGIESSGADKLCNARAILEDDGSIDRKCGSDSRGEVSNNFRISINASRFIRRRVRRAKSSRNSVLWRIEIVIRRVRAP